MRLHRQWHTQQASSVNLTVVTTATVGRLNQLRAQCNSWQGPIVAALWVPVIQQGGLSLAMMEDGLQHLGEVEQMVNEFHTRWVQSSACVHVCECRGAGVTPNVCLRGRRAADNTHKHTYIYAHAPTPIHTNAPPPRRVDSSGTCQLTILLMHELIADKLLGALMPINSLRNYALLAATTPLVAMVDVDLLVSQGLRQELGDPAK